MLNEIIRQPPMPVREDSGISRAMLRKKPEAERLGEKKENRSVGFFEQGARLRQQLALDGLARCLSQEFKKGNLSQWGFWIFACNYICFSEVNRICSLDFHFHAQSLELQVPPVNTMQTKYN